MWPIRMQLLVLNVFLGVFLSTEGMETCKSLVWLLSFDGFRNDYIHPERTPNLYRFKTQGSSAEYMKPVVPSLTFVNHFSLVSGQYVENHGVFANRVFDPKYGYMMYDERQFKYNEHIVPIFTLNEAYGGHSGSMMWPGADFNYENPFNHQQNISCTHVEKFTDAIPWNKRIDTIIKWFTEGDKTANFVLTYINEPDGVSHTYSPDSSEQADMLWRVDNLFGYIEYRLALAGLLEHMNIVVVSDHGMDTVAAVNIINLRKFLTPDTYDLYGSSPFLQIVPKSADVETEVREAAALSGTFKVYTCGESKRKNPLTNFPLEWRVCHGNERKDHLSRFASVFALAEPSYAFQELIKLATDLEIKHGKRYNLNQLYGSHGYDNSLSKMSAIFMARGPLINSGVKTDPINNVDVYSFLCRILFIPCYPTDGEDRVDIWKQMLRIPV